MNQKMKQETEQKYNLLRDKLLEQSISPQVVNFIKLMTTAAERNDFQGALNAHKEMA